jgi:hypothetical protein
LNPRPAERRVTVFERLRRWLNDAVFMGARDSRCDSPVDRAPRSDRRPFRSAHVRWRLLGGTAAEWRHKEIELAAHQLLQHLDNTQA